MKMTIEKNNLEKIVNWDLSDFPENHNFDVDYIEYEDRESAGTYRNNRSTFDEYKKGDVITLIYMGSEGFIPLGKKNKLT